MDLKGQDKEHAQKTLINRMIARIETCIPGRVKSFDADRQLLVVEPAIRKYVTQDDKQRAISIPPVIEVPITIPYAQTLGYALTIPIQPGDEVLLEVSHKSIDNWVQTGGIVNPTEPTVSRHHQITDSLAIVGLISVPKALPSYQTNAIEMRNRNRDTRVTLKNDLIENWVKGTYVKVTPDIVEAVAGTVEAKLDKNLQTFTVTIGDTEMIIDGINETIDINADNGVTINGIPWLHVHDQDDDSGADSEQPTDLPRAP